MVDLASSAGAVACWSENTIYTITGGADQELVRFPRSSIGSCKIAEGQLFVVTSDRADHQLTSVIVGSLEGDRLIERERRQMRNAISAIGTSGGTEYFVVCEASFESYLLYAIRVGDPQRGSSVEFPRVPSLRLTPAGLIVAAVPGHFVAAYDDRLRCVWRRELDAAFRQRLVFSRVLTILGELVLCNIGSRFGGSQGGLIAFSLADGSERWRAEFPSEVSFWHDDGTVYCCGGGSMWAIDVATGKCLVDGAFAVDRGTARDTLWSDGHYLWYASAAQDELLAFERDGKTLLKTYNLPAPFAVSPASTATCADGWAFLPLWVSDTRLRRSLAGLLRLAPGSELPEEVSVDPLPRHGIRTVPDGEREAYRIALDASTKEEVSRYGHILAASTACVHGASNEGDDDGLVNPEFSGRILLAIDSQELEGSARVEIEEAFEQVDRELEMAAVFSGDRRSKVHIDITSLEEGEADMAISTAFDVLTREAPKRVVEAPRPQEGGEEVPDMIADMLRGAAEEPAWRLGFALFVLGAAAFGGDDAAGRRTRVNLWLQQRYSELKGFPQELVFHTGVLLTTKDAASKLWAQDKQDPASVFDDVKRGIMQLAEWINAKKLSVDDGLASARLLRGMLAQVAGADGDLQNLPQQAKSVFAGIETALSEVERQLRQQS
jgi:hypothetical protein